MYHLAFQLQQKPEPNTHTGENKADQTFKMAKKTYNRFIFAAYSTKHQADDHEESSPPTLQRKAQQEAREKYKSQQNLTTMMEISSELFLASASSVRCFAAALASFMFLIESAASWFVIT